MKFRSFKEHILSFLRGKQFFIICRKVGSEVHLWLTQVGKESNDFFLGVFSFTAFLTLPWISNSD